MRYYFKQEKFHEENTRTLRIFFSAHPASLRETSSQKDFINCISSVKMEIILLVQNFFFRRTRITQMKRMFADFYQCKSVQSMSSVF